MIHIKFKNVLPFNKLVWIHNELSVLENEFQIDFVCGIVKR